MSAATPTAAWALSRAAARSIFALILPAILAALLGCPVEAAGSAAVNADVWGTVAVSVQHERMGGIGTSTAGILDGRLEVRADWERWWTSVTLEPSARAGFADGSLEVASSLRVTEAFAAYRGVAVDLYAGRVALPVETSRLTLPYTLTPPDEAGRRSGLDGARADVYMGSNRLQLAAVRVGGRWTPVAALRHASSGWEASGRFLLEEAGLAAGLGWSGLLGTVVAYGEVWQLPGEARPRFSTGATGYLGDGVWTAELARAPFLPGAGTPVTHAAWEVAYAPAPGLRWVAGAAAALEGGKGEGPPTVEKERAHRWGIAATYELVPGISEIELSVQRLVTPWLPATLSAGAGIRYYF